MGARCQGAGNLWAMETSGPGVEAASELIAQAERITVLTGAGISTESGIPDFRGPNGVWTKDPAAEKLFTLQNYLADPDMRVRAWQTRLEHPAWTATPNAGHEAIVELERRGKLRALVTQNIDGLHLAAGSSPEKTIEIHGTIHEVMCMSCDDRAPMHKALDRVRRGEVDPECRSCGGILKSATISFGQSLVPEDLDAARRAAGDCDLLLAAGTSLQVYPVAYLPQYALQAGATLVIVNQEPTPFDRHAAAVLREPIGTALPLIVGMGG
jgi:NAD-dependent deacetylase